MKNTMGYSGVIVMNTMGYAGVIVMFTLGYAGVSVMNTRGHAGVFVVHYMGTLAGFGRAETREGGGKRAERERERMP